MAELLFAEPMIIDEVDISHLITEDETPVDSLPSEKNQRLMTNPLYDTLHLERPFLAATNVAVYRALHVSALVPDMFLSLDVAVAEDFWEKKNRAYLVWEFGKPPEVVVEIVSNKKGNELGTKLRDYALLGAWYYVVYDPHQKIQDKKLVVYELMHGQYKRKSDHVLNAVGLSAVLWEGEFEDTYSEWLRWADLDSNLLPTGKERAERLASKLRELGIDPDTL